MISHHLINLHSLSLSVFSLLLDKEDNQRDLSIILLFYKKVLNSLPWKKLGREILLLDMLFMVYEIYACSKVYILYISLRTEVNIFPWCVKIPICAHVLANCGGIK